MDNGTSHGHVPSSYGGLTWNGFGSYKYDRVIGNIRAPPVSGSNMILTYTLTNGSSIEAHPRGTFTLLSLYVASYCWTCDGSRQSLTLTAYDAAGKITGSKVLKPLNYTAFQLVDLTAESAFNNMFKVTFGTSELFAAMDDIKVLVKAP